MKSTGTVCIVLLALVLLLQARILSQLDAIRKLPRAVAVPSPASPAAVAAEIRKQMAREAALAGPPSFTFYHRRSGANEKGVKFAEFGVVREGGPATGLAVVGPAGTTSTITREESTEDWDRYLLAFKPENGLLPPTWPFSLRYADKSGATQDQAFQVTYMKDQKPPDHLKVRKQ